MHDPCTVAFDIRYPWYRTRQWGNGKKRRYHRSFITIWHVDPETDGSDDSCGFAFPKSTEADRALVKELARQEFDFWVGKYGNSATGGIPFSAHEMIWWAWQLIANRRQTKRVLLSRSEAEEIMNLSANPHDNIRRRATECGSIEGLEAFLSNVDRLYRYHHRPWYRHAKWHVRHWRIQVHPWHTFRRWAFSRCAHCGKRFPWGYSPVSHQWDQPRPRWFRSEVGSYHSECSAIVCAQAEAKRARERGEVN